MQAWCQWCSGESGSGEGSHSGLVMRRLFLGAPSHRHPTLHRLSCALVNDGRITQGLEAKIKRTETVEIRRPVSAVWRVAAAGRSSYDGPAGICQGGKGFGCPIRMSLAGMPRLLYFGWHWPWTQSSRAKSEARMHSHICLHSTSWIAGGLPARASWRGERLVCLAAARRLRALAC